MILISPVLLATYSLQILMLPMTSLELSLHGVQNSAALPSATAVY